ncbi:MAG: peptidoglycan DD-metalloendopeptidase family protein [Alphaproteobacteria bacterium]|nr:peptidoglycan DD-metalloendopeptidase family protein [Alphaproteobacteria bacterium]
MLPLLLEKTFKQVVTKKRKHQPTGHSDSHTDDQPFGHSHKHPKLSMAHLKNTTAGAGRRFSSSQLSSWRSKLKAGVSFIARHLGVKERHVMTREGRLRLRYVATPVALVCAIALSISVLPDTSTARLMNDIESAAGADMADAEMGRNNAHAKMAANADLSLANVMSKVLPGPTEKVVTVESGQALGVVMEKAGIGSTESSEVIAAMKEHFDPRKLKAGQNIHMKFEPAEDGQLQFANMKMAIDPLKTLVVTREGDSFQSVLDEKQVERKVRAKGTKIEVSLYGSAAKMGIPQSVVAQAIKIYSQNIDFQRDIRQGDKLEVMYDSYETEDGYVAKTGDVIYAKLTLNGKEIPLYRYKDSSGRLDYYSPEGRSIRRTLMKTPIDGARMSSGYGMRRHPVLGYTKMHKGVDFAAPIGTPIFASGDGVIEKAGRFSSYGNYIRIRHNSQLSTAYAHLSRIKVSPGARVRQGDVIGLVGNTGRSTGPHLHYEILVNGRHVNPNSVNLPVGENLQGKEFKRFKQEVRGVEQQFVELYQGQKFAFLGSNKDKVN